MNRNKVYRGLCDVPRFLFDIVRFDNCQSVNMYLHIAIAGFTPLRVTLVTVLENASGSGELNPHKSLDFDVHNEAAHKKP